MSFVEYIIYLYNFALGMGAVLALIMIIGAGIKIVQSQGNPSEIQNAKQKIINSLIGLAVLLTSYILLTTINPNIINIQNINLGTTGITVPIVTPVVKTEEVTNYDFEEIPIGTITEGILAGVSTKNNALPCYEYEEEKTYNDNGRIIIGDTIDQNEDGVINDKDVILNKDVFYCIKMLDKAIKNKTETHLKLLINELDKLLQKNCSCTNCYHSSLNQDPWDCAVTNCNYCVPYEGNDCTHFIQNCSGCSTCNYHCHCCGDYANGCKDAPGWTEESKINKSCSNPEIIDCKRQEIKQLTTGITPDEYCYKEGYIIGFDEGQDSKTEANQTRLTFQTAMQRMSSFKQYYINGVAKLASLESKMKSPYGERLTASELYNNVETRNSVSVKIQTFEGYDASRYCRDYCMEYDYEDKANGILKYDSTGQAVCKSYGFNAKNRICRMDEEAKKTVACEKAEGAAEDEACKEYYTYSGDPATFYFKKEYNDDYKSENQVMDATDNKCNVSEQNMNAEMYGGLIPIGETVDYTEEWGTEVARQIGTMVDEINGIATTAGAIADFPTQCNCSGNCTQKVPVNCCRCSCTGENCCPSATCQFGSGNHCSECEAAAIVRTGVYCTETYKEEYYTGCRTCDKYRDPIYEYKDVAKPLYYVCPFYTMCGTKGVDGNRDTLGYIGMIYQIGGISDSCFYASATDAEELKKETERSHIGYLKRFEIRERMLFDLSGISANNGNFATKASILFPELDCLTGCDEIISDGLTCESSALKAIPSRITLLNMLKTSRERLEGCVKGYSYPYKQGTSVDNVRIMSCYEADNSKLTISPEFPYPDKSKEASPYINCYPYNSSSLTAEQQRICFYDISRTGVESNPGCLFITKSYMDNYYCCQ